MMNVQMCISVIVPTFNRSDMLRNCIESLLNQTLDSALYEVIIVDNNSTDATRQTIHEYTGLQRYNVRYVLEPQQGLQYARNTGAKAAQTVILAYTDDDAVCDERWLERLLLAYDDEEIGCAGGKIIVKWDKDPPKWVLRYDFFGQLDESRLGPTFRILQPGEYIFGGNCSMRKSVLFELGGFSPDQIGEVLTGEAEIGLWIKAYKKGIKIAWVPDAIVWHMQTVDKNATLPDMKRRFRNWGVTSTSMAYLEKPRGSLSLLLSSIRSFYSAIRYKLVALASGQLSPSMDYHSELQSSFFFKKALFELNLSFRKKRRELFLRENWLE
jgi:glycosyltransferase involved in cell wall biosynthesis